MEVAHLNTYEKITSFQKEISKQLYDEGVQQRNQLNSKFTPTITILTAELGGVIWLVFKIIEKLSENIDLHQLCCFLLISITALIFGVAMFFFVLCFTRYNFYYISPQKVNNFIESNKQCLNGYSEEVMLNNIIQNISNTYMNVAIQNDNETTKHSNYLNNCYIFIVLTLIFLVIDFIIIFL